MLGDFKKTTKRNLLKGIPWRFGPNWPGKRCEAKTKKGSPFNAPPNYQWVDAGFMEVSAQVQGPRKA